MSLKKNLINAGKHFKKICTHKYWVFHYCCKAGIPWQGIKHDLSKFSPTEFVESVKYYQGDRSPIDACKEDKGYSMAWLHHKGKNKHHYEYWQDNFDNGGEALEIPLRYRVEMICDFMGAGHAYHGKDFTIQKELGWWENKKSKPLAMTPHTIQYLDTFFIMLEEAGEEKAFNYIKESLKFNKRKR